MTNAEIEFYMAKGRSERSKAFYAGFRAIKRALTGVAGRLRGGFAHLHQPKAFQ
jgi:hypothetical protein